MLDINSYTLIIVFIAFIIARLYRNQIEKQKDKVIE